MDMHEIIRRFVVEHWPKIFANKLQQMHDLKGKKLDLTDRINFAIDEINKESRKLHYLKAAAYHLCIAGKKMGEVLHHDWHTKNIHSITIGRNNNRLVFQTDCPEFAQQFSSFTLRNIKSLYCRNLLPESIVINPQTEIWHHVLIELQVSDPL